MGGFASYECLPALERGRVGTDIPKVDLEIPRPEEGKQIGLLAVFVRTSCDAGKCLADVSHARMVAWRQLVFTVHFNEPAALVLKWLKRPYDDAVDRSLLKHRSPGISYPRGGS